MLRLTLLALSAFVLSGCDSDSPADSDDQVQLELAIERYLDNGSWHNSSSIHGYIAKHGVEVLYGYELFTYRVNEGEWILADDNIYVLGVEILTPQHWVRTIVRDIYSMDAAYYVEETENAGVTWSSTLFDSENPAAEYVSALAYDYNNNLIYTAYNLALAVSELPIEQFNVLESSGADLGVALKLLLNPNRNELWWIGHLALAFTGNPENDAHVRRFQLSAAGVNSEDMTAKTGLSRTFGGLVYKDDPNMVFIAGEGGISRTENSGSSWKLIFDAEEVTNVVYSETTGNLYWTTFYSGVVEVFCSQDLAYSWSSSPSAKISAHSRISHTEINGDKLIVILDRQQPYAVDIPSVTCGNNAS